MTESKGFPGGSDGKEPACNAGNLDSMPGSGRSLEKGLATHSSILAWEGPMNRGTWQVTVHGVAELDASERLTLSLF